MSIKRIDRTPQLMRDLEKSAEASVKEAAIMLKVIARKMVSRKYVRKGGTKRTALQQAIFEQRRREVSRKYLLNLPAKRRDNATTQTTPVAGAAS
jgi:hypothetical protein